MVSASLNGVGRDTALAGRLTVFCQDVPYPANHGGKLDLWNLIQGLHHEGLTIQLVCWFKDQRIGPDTRRALATVAADVVEVRRRDGWWRLLYARYPPRMLSFKPSPSGYAELKKSVQTFGPDWFLLDYWLAYLPARRLATDLQRPLVYRSQNVEHRYYRDLRRVAHGVLKMKLALNAVRLAAAEREIRAAADLVADISADDLQEWNALGGAGNALVVPPVWFPPPEPASHDLDRDIDLLFVGNLRTPNNVEGLSWLVDEVLPIVRTRTKPRDIRVVFAGSEPDAEQLKRWRAAGVQCVPNPSDVAGFYQRARVVVNPLQRGSGVNLKMIEALASGRPVVATPIAIRGLPDEVRSYFAVGSSPLAFASAALALLDSPEDPIDKATRAALVNQFFGTARLRPLIGMLHQMRPPGSGATTVVA